MHSGSPIQIFQLGLVCTDLYVEIVFCRIHFIATEVQSGINLAKQPCIFVKEPGVWCLIFKNTSFKPVSKHEYDTDSAASIWPTTSFEIKPWSTIQTSTSRRSALFDTPCTSKLVPILCLCYYSFCTSYSFQLTLDVTVTV